MGFSEKAQVDGGLEASENRKWVIAGIALRAPLKPIYTVHGAHVDRVSQDDDCDTDECSTTTTPTGEEARVPTTLTCPPAPRKRKPSFKKCNNNYRRAGGGGGGVGVREFFTPPDLETVFIRHVEVERAN